MRIALTSSFFRPKTSGSAHFSSGLAGELTRQGHEVLVVTCTPADGHDDTTLPYEVVRLPAIRPNLGRISFGYEIPFCSPGAVRTLGRALSTFRPHVVHLNEQFFDLSVWAGLWARRHRVPRVMTLHTAFTHNVPWMHRTLRAVDATVVATTLAAYDPTFVAIDKFMANYARARFPRRRQEFIPIPVRTDVFAGGDGDVARERLGVHDEEVILSLGHAIPLRDRLLLVRALPEILADHPRAKVVVVGRVYDDRFLRLADELGVRHAVVADGEVPHSEVKHYVAAATLECHETQGYGLGTASLEVMASGLPVAAVVDDDNFPGFALRQREHLMMADDDPRSLAAAIGALLDDPILRKTVAEGAHRLIAERFRIERVAEEYVALYERERAAAGG